MNGLQQRWYLLIRSLASSSRVIQAFSRALSERLNFGIATRQLAAFVCVAVLALAANFIVEKGGLIERTTEIVRQSPLDVPPKPVALPTPAIADPLPVRVPD